MGSAFADRINCQGNASRSFSTSPGWGQRSLSDVKCQEMTPAPFPNPVPFPNPILLQAEVRGTCSSCFLYCRIVGSVWTRHRQECSFGRRAVPQQMAENDAPAPS